MAIALIVLITIGLLALGFYYFNFFKPKRDIKNLAEQFTKNNWNVYVEKFNPMSTSIFDDLEQSYLKYKDSMYAQKFEYSKYDVSIGNINNKTYVQVHSPGMVQEFFQHDNERYLVKSEYFVTYEKKMSGDAISFATGELWKQKRKVISKFLNFGYLRELGQKIYNVTDQKFKQFFENNILPQKQNNEQVSEFYLQNLVELVPSTIIVEVFFGGASTSASLQIDGKTLPEYLRILLDELRNNMMDPLIKIFGFKFTKLGLRHNDRELNRRLWKWRTFTRNFIVGRFSQIREQKQKKKQLKSSDNQESKPNDLTQAFYEQFESKGVKDKQMMIESLMNDFADLLIAGTQASATTVVMAVYLIHKHKDVKETLLKELSAIKSEDLKDVNNFKKLKYLECVLWETMRLHQVENGMFHREVLNDFKIGGVTMKKGSIVNVSTFAIHYQNKLYDDAKCFKPERWIQENGDVKSIDSNRFLSFGSGIRNCVGKALGLIKTKTILAYLMKNFEAEFETLDLQLNSSGIAGYGPQPIKMKLKRKKQSKI